jgi:hypothetical protein|tara:strand:+ start:59 stop:277 length:219 start_codon:yes stop_codon:yes gene_type:complete
MTRVLLILFLLTSSVNAECKYSATADVENNQLVNKVEKYTCKEDDNFFVKFLTHEEYHYAFTTVFFTLLEAL